jgi:hypothetical protein
VQKFAEKNFALSLNAALNSRRWTPTRLFVEANSLNEDEAFSQRSLHYWLSGKSLPKIEHTVAIAEALKMPELIRERVEFEIDKFRHKKTAN